MRICPCFNGIIIFIKRNLYLHWAAVSIKITETVIFKAFFYTFSTCFAVFRLNIYTVHNPVRTIFCIVISGNHGILSVKNIIQMIGSFGCKTMSARCAEFIYTVIGCGITYVAINITCRFHTNGFLLFFIFRNHNASSILNNH